MPCRFAATNAILNTPLVSTNYVRRTIAKRAQEVREGKMNIYYDDESRPEGVSRAGGAGVSGLSGAECGL